MQRIENLGKISSGIANAGIPQCTTAHRLAKEPHPWTDHMGVPVNPGGLFRHLHNVLGNAHIETFQKGPPLPLKDESGEDDETSAEYPNRDRFHKAVVLRTSSH